MTTSGQDSPHVIAIDAHGAIAHRRAYERGLGSAMGTRTSDGSAGDADYGSIGREYAQCIADLIPACSR